MKQLLSTHSRFCSAKKKKEVVCEARTHDLHVTARRSTTPKKKKKKGREVVFVRLELRTFTL